MVTLDGRDLNKALRRGVNGQMTSKQPENILTVGGKDHCIGEKENMLFSVCIESVESKLVKLQTNCTVRLLQRREFSEVKHGMKPFL